MSNNIESKIVVITIQHTPPNSGPVVLWWGVGSLAAALPTLAPFTAFRLVSSVAQSAVRSLVAVVKA